jgi:outer membrane protein insertion porin family
VNAREGSSPQQVVVDVNVEETTTGSLSFGGTYSTSDGFGAAVEFRERNFLGRGQSFQLGVSTAASTREYTLKFVEPAFLGRDVAFGLNLSYAETDNYSGDYDTAIGIFQPSLEFPVSENGRLGLRYTFDHSELTDLESTVGALITAEAAQAGLWQQSLGYTYSYDTRRTGLNPNAGVLLEFGQDFGVTENDDNFIKTAVRAVAQTKVLNEEITLRAVFEGGALNYSGGSGSRVTDRYFMGSNVMRGFQYGGIGPREVNAGSSVNDALGGNYFAVARFEAEFPLGLPDEYGITGGVFYDIGSLWGLDSTNSDTLYSDFSTRQVVGFSIFWATAIGPLRFNFPEALHKETFDETTNFDLTISTQF